MRNSIDLLLKGNINLKIVVFMCAFVTAPSLAVDWSGIGKDLLEGAKSQSSNSNSSNAGANLSNGDIASALKQALTIGSGNVVSQLGKSGGFSNDSNIYIPLPESLNKVKSALKLVGMDGMLQDLELKLNAAAEVATPKAKSLFTDAIKQMTLDDARGILNGPNDSATRYFQSKMSAPLAKEMIPIVGDSLAKVGAVKQYDSVMAEYENIPFVPDAKANLNEYVVDKAMGGIFHYLAVEEAAIRQNPVKRTTELLKRVFSQ